MQAWDARDCALSRYWGKIAGELNHEGEKMNSKTWTRIIALILFAALALPLQLDAQKPNAKHHPFSPPAIQGG
jgi:hypothetical protein